jgi:ribose/xylose/arabinose/galactoside ABC-type transport system permease subunit
MITTGMIIHNIEPLIQQLIVGIILIITVFIDTRMGWLREAGYRAVKKGVA